MRNGSTVITTVTPCYNEEEALPLFYKELCRVAEKMPEIEFESYHLSNGKKHGTGQEQIARYLLRL